MNVIWMKPCTELTCMSNISGVRGNSSLGCCLSMTACSLLSMPPPLHLEPPRLAPEKLVAHQQSVIEVLQRWAWVVKPHLIMSNPHIAELKDCHRLVHIVNCSEWSAMQAYLGHMWNKTTAPTLCLTSRTIYCYAERLNCAEDLCS